MIRTSENEREKGKIWKKQTERKEKMKEKNKKVKHFGGKSRNTEILDDDHCEVRKSV